MHTALARQFGLLCRHHTQSAEKRSLTLKLFMAQFVNTALSSLVANMYIPALYKRLQNTFLGSLIFQVSYRLYSLSLSLHSQA